MTSCVFSLFFLVSLISSITVVDPTGLKLRITDRGLDVLKGLGIMFLEELENKVLPDIPIPLLVRISCKLSRVKITNFRVDPDQVVFRYQEDSSLLFEIRNLDFRVELQQDINICFFRKFNLHSSTVTLTGSDMMSTIQLRLNRNHRGHLNAENLKCEVSGNNVESEVNSRLRIPNWLYQWIITSKVCPAAVSNLNGMLESMAMMTAVLQINQNFTTLSNISLDYSLSGDIAVTPHSLDVPFKGRVFSQEVANDDPIEGPADPVFRETNLMAYIGVSEFFFNSAARLLYRSQPFQVDVPKSDKVDEIKMLVTGLPILPEGLALLEFTETPTISINEKTGLSANVEARVQSKDQPDISILVACRLNMTVNYNGSHLVVVNEKAKCKVPDAKRFKDTVNTNMNKWIEDFLKGVRVPIPLPDGVGFTETENIYHDGFLVVGGDLNFSPVEAKKALQGLSR